MTIPTLVNSYEKKVAVTKLQRFYTNFSQAVALSEIENGPHSDWDFGGYNNAEGIQNSLKKHIIPYMKTLETYTANNIQTGAGIKLINGSEVRFRNGHNVWDILKACNKSKKSLCATLIQYDGWRIADDYPW